MKPLTNLKERETERSPKAKRTTPNAGGLARDSTEGTPQGEEYQRRVDQESPATGRNARAGRGKSHGRREPAALMLATLPDSPDSVTNAKATDKTKGAYTMDYTITTNAQYNSLEISFDGKPSEEVRDALKALRFRWHGQRRVWYGYKDEQTVRAAIEGNTQTMTAHKDRNTKATKPATVNKYGVKVGDIFRATWGYEQTNNDFFQVVALVGESSVRVREVYLPMTDSDPVSPMSEDRTFSVVRDILPPADRSVFIHDQKNGDVKRLKSWAKDGKSNPQFKLTDYANAYFVSGDSIKVYESWYA